MGYLFALIIGFVLGWLLQRYRTIIVCRIRSIYTAIEKELG